MKLDELRAITARAEWARVAHQVLSGARPVAIEDFGTYWIEAGHRVREQVADDRVLAAMLRKLLPPYTGPAMTLYRGENLVRWDDSKLGFAWTTDIEVARMFARGLNALYAGGVLLRGTFDARCIISGPNAHSNYLDEAQFTVDPAVRPTAQVLERFAAAK